MFSRNIKLLVTASNNAYTVKVSSNAILQSSFQAISTNLPICFYYRCMATKASSTFQTKPYKLHRLDTGPSTEITCTREDALKFYTEMATVRRLEAAANSLYKEKAVRGFCHLYTGQEAVCVGMEAAIT